MVLNPNLIFYSCVAKENTILAEFTKDPNLVALALQCIEKTPPYHLMYSHTIRKRTYTFLIDDLFLYFGIFDENLDKSEVLWFLNRIKSVFGEIIRNNSLSGFNNFTSYCFQSQFDSVFREVVASDLDLMNFPLTAVPIGSQNPSLDSAKGKQASLPSLLVSPNNGLKKKKRLPGEANGEVGKEVTSDKKVDVCDDIDGICSREFSLLMQKNISHMGERQKAKQIWKKHVWVVLLLDLFVCLLLFAIWLWVCRGFQCIDS